MKKSIILIVYCLISNINNAQTWSAVGNGVNGRVSCFEIYNDELYVGGQFDVPGTNMNIGLMKWNGVLFDTLPGTYLLGSFRVEAMEVYNNELYVGGGFCTGCSPVASAFENIAKWDGSSFTSVGTGCSSVVYSMRVFNGNLYVGGDMGLAGGDTVNHIARWNGNQWSPVANGIALNARVFELEVYNNELYAAGNFNFTDINTMCIARWNETTWNEVGIGGIPGVVYSLGIYNNELYAGGPYFTQAGGVAVNQIAKWNGITWSQVGTGIGNNVGHLYSLIEYHDELYAGGEFSIMDGDSINSIARYNGSTWNSVGSGVDSTTIAIDTIYNFPFLGDTTYYYAPHKVSAFIEFNNELYVGGNFNMIGEVAAHSIAKWSTPVGVEKQQSLISISVFPNPATNKISIEGDFLNEEVQLQLTDVLGREIKTGILTNTKTTIDVSEVQEGIYFLILQTINATATKKIIVQRR